MSNLKNDLKLYLFLAIIFIIYFIADNLLFDEICPFLYIFGFPCAGCGMTRAMTFLLSLRFEEALKTHPFSIVFFGYFLYFVFYRYFHGKDFRFFITSFIVLLVLYFAFFTVSLLIYSNYTL